jgi:cytochrome c553
VASGTAPSATASTASPRTRRAAPGGENVEYLMRQLKAFKAGERKHEQMSIIAQA